MGTIMAPRANQDAAAAAAAAAIDHPSPKATKPRPRTKAGTIPASDRPIADAPKPSTANISTSSGSGSFNIDTTITSHAPASARQTASSNITSDSTSLVSYPVGTALEARGAMNVNANIKPNLQPAPATVSTHAQPAGRAQVAEGHTRGSAPNSLQLQHSRPSSVVHQQHHQQQQQQHHPGSPAHAPLPTQYDGGSHSADDSIAIQQHHFVPGHGSNDPRHTSQAIPYLQGPYAHQPGTFQVAGDGRVLMAATMPPYPNIYSTNQPQSPASVSSPHSQDVQNRQFMNHPQMASSMYSGYNHYPSMSHVQQPPYAHAARTQAPQALSSQPLLMSQQQQQHQQHSPSQMAQQHNRSPTSVQQSPRSKLEPSAMPIHRPLDSAGVMHRPPQQVMTNTAQMPPGSAGSLQQSPRSAGGANSSAAPGPIPASTPRVVREDSDGTMWIEFEYSKDRVKMDYSIKCNVDSVDLSTLSDEFKANNCVYPRAMKPREEYHGNRYAYETECNNVGWALAKMNETLQGKRGLIQRAVDSWRNSSQDQKLRSRRVRRQQKMAKRDKEKSSGPSQVPVVPGTPISAQRPQSMHGSLDMGGGQPYHHHAVTGGPGGMGGGGDDVVTGAGRFIRPTPEAAYAPSMSLSMSMSNAPAPSYHHPQLASSPGAVAPAYAQHHQHQQHPHAHQGLPVSYPSMQNTVQYYQGGSA